VADLMISRRHVALNRWLKTFGFAGDCADVWEPEEL